MDTPKQIRRQLRTLRSTLSAEQREQAAAQLSIRVATLKVFQEAQHIAGYLAFDGEMDPERLLQQALAAGKTVYLPILMGKAPMRFAPYRSGDPLVPNYFGIPEPQVPKERLLSPQGLDLVLTPLVAFDESGTRMGMGGGFYDRSFAFLNHPGHPPKPQLLGLAYELQKLPALNRQPWDIPLHSIATEATLYPGASGQCLE